MDSPTIYIGIPQWPWKKHLLARAEANPYRIEIDPAGLAYECSRHREILEMFDRGEEDFKDTEYYKYQIKNKRSVKQISEKIQGFKKLYESIKRFGCIVPPTVTSDGCRLDGSHRSSIITHLKKPIAMVNLARYEEHFDYKECKAIREQVKDFRRSYYGLDPV
jgi:hypothetical protein